MARMVFGLVFTLAIYLLFLKVNRMYLRLAAEIIVMYYEERDNGETDISIGNSISIWITFPMPPEE